VKTIVLTTPNAIGRQQQVAAELDRWGIGFEFYFAQPAATNEISCSNAHRDILLQNQDEDWLFVLEDDVYFDQHPLKVSRPPGFWQYYFGGYVTAPLRSYNSEWWITSGNWGGYATLYSWQGIDRIVKRLSTFANHQPPALDDWFCKVIHPLGFSLLRKEFIAHTRPGLSMITNDVQDHDRDVMNQYKIWTGN